MSLVKSEIETLQDENNQLRAEISRLEACRVAAATWLTLYDGGKDDSKETLLEHIHKAESILDDADKKGKNHQYIIELFDEWIKVQCNSCTKKHMNEELNGN